MKDKRISLQDIANLTGVTKMTISRYLKNPKQVSEKNQEKIAKVLKEIQYIPNLAPQIMLGSRSHCIGIVIPSFKNQIFTEVLAGIESVASAHNYQTIITNYNYDKQLEEEKIINLLSYNVDALVLMEKEHTQTTLQYLKTANIPVVELMDITKTFFDIQVGFDNEQAAYDMTLQMIESGKKNIIYFNSIASARDSQRYKGYQCVMKQSGLTPRQIIPNAISSIDLGKSLFHQAIQKYPDMDGILCTNDDMAIGVLLECQNYQIPVPEQIAIAGFHGLEIGRANNQKIATVITPRFEIGKVSIELLLQKLNGERVKSSVNLDYKIDKGQTI
ncbi:MULTISPECIES: substrate-binding domain-containing protein [unclassified Gilliamella]|uniref:DNA-binding transcriptional regulator IdnR n=1 Tax=unclassified Gilliamella TaxID=2685620 RepID=UPI00130CC380|nr:MULTISPECIES: substrate-binding domain-containing protein [unclassified Gilliamella]MWP48274.1 substrate-binding domain-containing protein [Gilliamella sp. Lep-s35]MWP68194.1 substrate-binding domain-containing protein [Gilliamella sp. Lep-s5]MWP76414.1 substrate-binding domain-containing protein [Gilliamella sp. Lep-s21]